MRNKKNKKSLNIKASFGIYDSIEEMNRLEKKVRDNAEIVANNILLLTAGRANVYTGINDSVVDSKNRMNTRQYFASLYVKNNKKTSRASHIKSAVSEKICAASYAEKVYDKLVKFDLSPNDISAGERKYWIKYISEAEKI